MMTKVKICGITNLKDAKRALELGADALGFIFTNSPRCIDPKTAAKIIDQAGPFASMVGVFVNQKPEWILKVASNCRLDALQLHGEESPRMCRNLSPYKIIKTFRVGELFPTSPMKHYDVDAYLFETEDAKRGGTGRTWAWESCPVKRIRHPFVVSGGLTPANVGHAVKVLAPYAVDVSSGVERKIGIKDPKLMERFIRNAKQQ